MADPTLDMLRKLDDESQWVIRRGVPVFKPHTRYNPDGTVKYVVSESDLPTIAERSNRLEREHAVVGRVTGGHVNPALSPKEQPALLGAQRNYRVGTFGPSNEPCIVADRYCYPEHAAAADKLPFRSAEYYHGAREIRGTALLMIDPYLDLGFVTYESDRVMTTYEAEPPVEPNPNAAQAQPTPEEVEAFKAMIAKYPSLLEACGLQVKPAAAGSAPADEMQRMQREQQAIQYAALQASNTSLAATVAALQAENTRSKCEQMVMQLEAEGYQLDRAYETGELAGRDEPKRAAYVTNLKSRYQKVPVGEKIQLYQGQVESGSAAIEQAANVEKANHYMRENGITDFMAAYAAVTKK